MKQRIAEWHLQPELSEARRIREAVAGILQLEGGDQYIDVFQLACAELIVNLSRYPEPKPSEVTMTLSKDEQYWWLELKDNGPTFNNFSQLVNDTELPEAAESGMGLKLLAQMFPDIRYVPACYREDACNLMLLRQPIHSENQPRKTLLLVDDDPSFRAIISAYLKSDYQVIETENVEQAFAAILQYQPDLVICDIQMPDQEGPALFDQIAHIPDVADTAFIYLSGVNDEAQIRRALTRPIDDFLAKPVSRAELLSCIERVIQRRSYLNQQIRYELEQKISLGLQPQLPETIPGYNLQLRSINPEAGGGDLVLLQQHDSHSLILMADLMGHGLSAKGYSFALAGYLRGLSSAASQNQFDLSSLFQLLSKAFNQDELLRETLATLIAVQLTEEGDLEWVNAGQPCPVLIRTAVVEPIKVEGALPGIGFDQYETVNIQLSSEERVLLYSDGFTDAAEPLSNSLRAAIEQSRKMPLSAAADYLLAERLKSGKAEDDLTLIMIEKTASQA